MEQSLPFVSVVVPTYNRAELLRDCLESLLAQDYPRDRYEIIAVDDGSTDTTEQVVRVAQAQSGRSSIRFLHQEHNGVNATRNAGLSVARGEVVALVDDDELPPPGYLRCAVELLEKHPEAAGVGGPYKDYGPGCVRTCQRCSLGRAHINEAEHLQPVASLPGGNMVLRREVFRAVGFFDEDLSGYGDEWEWFERPRARSLSLVFLYVPELWIWHRKGLIPSWRLYATALRQELSVPLAAKKVGRGYHPNLLRLIRYLGHAALRGCGSGLVAACREAGALLGWVQMECGRWDSLRN